MGIVMSNHEMPLNVDVLAAGQLDDMDGRLLAAIADLYAQRDPMPGGLVERIKFGITLDALNAEIAQLQRMDAGALARSEDATSVQTVTFTSQSLTTMVTISPVTADTVRVDGWAVPGAGVTVELRTSARTWRTVADEDGRFAFEDIDRGLAQFVLRAPEGRDQPPVVTPPMEL